MHVRLFTLCLTLASGGGVTLKGRPQRYFYFSPHQILKGAMQSCRQPVDRQMPLDFSTTKTKQKQISFSDFPFC